MFCFIVLKLCITISLPTSLCINHTFQNRQWFVWMKLLQSLCLYHHLEPGLWHPGIFLDWSHISTLPQRLIPPSAHYRKVMTYRPPHKLMCFVANTKTYKPECSGHHSACNPNGFFTQVFFKWLQEKIPGECWWKTQALPHLHHQTPTSWANTVT